jgi:uncharacterized protein YfiM (DUF2279 family)
MIYVALGDSDISEMRRWFDRATTAQLDYAGAWNHLRWGLRPRWYGDRDSMLALGVAALKTRRFDTDVPRKYFDSLSDVEEEMGLPAGEHLYGRDNIWPHLQELYEGYLAEPSLTAYCKNGWRSSYTTVAYLAGQYEVARQQLEALDWRPSAANLTGWKRDLSLLPLEVAARTSPQSAQVAEAERLRADMDAAGALAAYQKLAAATNLDARTRSFVEDREATLELEKRLQAGDWVDFLPTRTNLTGWHAELGKFTPLPDGALEVQSDTRGHLIYSRVRIGENLEVRGEFEVVSSSTKAFQAGLVMGLPERDSYNWYAFRVKRNQDEGDVASFSKSWTTRQISKPITLNSQTNTFDLSLQHCKVSGQVNGQEVFDAETAPANIYVAGDEFLLGLGAFNDSNNTVIRYRHVQVRRLTSP